MSAKGNLSNILGILFIVMILVLEHFQQIVNFETAFMIFTQQHKNCHAFETLIDIFL